MRNARIEMVVVLFVCIAVVSLLVPTTGTAGSGCCARKKATGTVKTQAVDQTTAVQKSDSTSVENPGKEPYCGSEEGKKHVSKPENSEKTDKVTKSDKEWRACLTPEQYRVARQKGTEAAFTGKYWDTKTKGTYRCVACGQPLFSSGDKYDSGTGWPSFTAPVDPANVRAETDKSHGMVRSEVLCSRCGAHLGHVFGDGPEPTGMRYCINSAVLDLVDEEAEGKE